MKSLRKKARNHRLSEEFQALEAAKISVVYSHLSHDSDSHEGNLKFEEAQGEELHWEYGEMNEKTAGEDDILRSELDDLYAHEQIENLRRQMYPSLTPRPKEDLAASLERLPVELKVLILKEIPNLPALRNLTLACSAFYDVYIDQRSTILSTVLTRSLTQGLDVAACALLEVSQTKAGYGQLKKFVASYQVDRALCLPFTVEKGEDLVQIARDNLMIYDFTAQCVKQAISLRPVTGERASGTWGDFAALSRSEKRRFYRGFYNYEILCRLVRDLTGPARVPRNDERAVNSFLQIFEPWEIEEINSARYFVQRCYADIVKRCSPALGIVFGQTKLIDGRVITSAPCEDYTYRFESEWYREASEVCAGQGLRLLRAVQTARSPDDEVALLRPLLSSSQPPSRFMQRLWSIMYGSSLRSGVGRPWWYQGRRMHHPEPRYVGEHEGPNAALVWAEALASSLPAQWPQKEMQLAWAYVMWDRDRLEDWNVLSTGFRYMSHVYGAGSEKLAFFMGAGFGAGESVEDWVELE